MKNILLGLFCIFGCSHHSIAQCSLWDVYNGSAYFIDTEIAQACSETFSVSAYETGNALIFDAYAGITYTFSTCGGFSGGDTELHIYRYGGSWAELAYDDDGCGASNGESILSYTPSSNIRLILVTSQATCSPAAAALSFEISITGVANNQCSGAQVVTAGATAFNSTNACGEDISSCTSSDTRDVWFAYTAPNSGTAVFNTCGSAFDTGLSVWDGCGGSQIECNDDALSGDCSGTNKSEVSVSVNSGDTYYIRIAGYLEAKGSGTLNIIDPISSSLAGDDCSNPIQGAACGDNYTDQSANGLSNSVSSWSCAGGSSMPGSDVFYSFTADGDASTLRVTLNNVQDASNTYAEVLLMTGSCAAPTCLDYAQFDINSASFSSGVNFVDFVVSPTGSATTYYIVIDGQGDGIDSFDISMSCFLTAIQPGFACSSNDVNGDGVVTSFNGVTPAPSTVEDGESYTICHTVYINNPGGFEWLRYASLSVSPCLVDPENFEPNGSNNGVYRAGDWRVDSVNGSTAFYSFANGTNPCPVGQVSVSADFYTDGWGNETYWELVPDGAGCGSSSLIDNGGNLTLDCSDAGSSYSPPGGYGNNTVINEGPWCLDQGVDYDIEYVDSWGDGNISVVVNMNGQYANSYSTGSTGSATISFTADSTNVQPWGDGNNTSAGYLCNQYTFCYDAKIGSNGAPCTFGDSIQDVMTLTDDGIGGSGSTSVSSFSNITSSGDATVLPIELVSFDGQLTGEENVLLYWATLTEINTDRFEVFRSNGISGQGNDILVLTLAAAGESLSIKEYQGLDINPPGGGHYYYLKAIDLDGTYTTHGPVFVDVPFRAEDQISLAPNPTSSFVFISLTSEEARVQAWSVYSVNGTLISTGIAQLEEGKNRIKIDLSELPASIYQIQLPGIESQTGHYSTTLKVWKL